VAKGNEKDYEFETVCEYMTSKGDKGWILKIVPKKN
jgi:hypothetical protein